MFTPFLGIGSECYKAIEMGRRAMGIELKKSYYEQACKNVASVPFNSLYKKGLF